MWNTTPVDLELKDDAEPLYLRPYPVPRLHEAILIKEFERLVSLRVIGEANESEWGAPSFSQPKAKTNRDRFLSDFRKLNMQLKRKSHLMTEISKFLLK